jgi:branched-chain amino acid transport system ATP-binding protein
LAAMRSFASSLTAHAAAGRTFQTIRIFENLSVIENVKVAAACQTPTSLFNVSRRMQQQGEAKSTVTRGVGDCSRPAERTITPIALRAAALAGIARAGVSRMCCCSTSPPSA